MKSGYAYITLAFFGILLLARCEAQAEAEEQPQNGDFETASSDIRLSHDLTAAIRPKT